MTAVKDANVRIIKGLTYYCLQCKKYFFSALTEQHTCSICGNPGHRFISPYESRDFITYRHVNAEPITNCPGYPDDKSAISERSVGRALMDWESELGRVTA